MSKDIPVHEELQQFWDKLHSEPPTKERWRYQEKEYTLPSRLTTECIVRMITTSVPGEYVKSWQYNQLTEILFIASWVRIHK